MKHLGTILILLAPAVLATRLHARFMPKRRGPVAVLGLIVIYAFAIAWLLSCMKYLRGKGAILIADSFDTVKNLVVYGPVAAVFAALLPFFVRSAPRLRSRFAPRMRGSLSRLARAPRTPDPTRPAPEKPAETPLRVRTPDATLVQRTEASLAAQEAEMVVEHTKIVPSRRAAGNGPTHTLYNVGSRDAKAVKKTARQRLMWVLIYGLLALFAIVIVYGVIWSNWGS